MQKKPTPQPRRGVGGRWNFGDPLEENARLKGGFFRAIGEGNQGPCSSNDSKGKGGHMSVSREETSLHVGTHKGGKNKENNWVE